MPLSIAGQSDLRKCAWLLGSQSDESGMNTDANRRALLFSDLKKCFKIFENYPHETFNIQNFNLNTKWLIHLFFSNLKIHFPLNRLLASI